MKVRLIEYKCIVNEKMQPFGHAKKAIDDAVHLCNRLGIENEVAASSAFSDPTIVLENSIKVDEYHYRNYRRILKNIHMAITNKSDKDIILWFTNVDWYLFYYLGRHKVRNKIIVTIYKDRYDQIDVFKGKKLFIGDMLYGILKKGVNKVDLFLETFFSNERRKDAVYFPDYVYTSFYAAHRVDKKIAQVICPGTINHQKDILGLVRVFNKIDYPLLIIGEFVDSKVFEEVNKIANTNIKVENRRLGYEEYYRVIAESQYCITPYDMQIYRTSTSGVFREAVYLGTTVIAPRVLLDNVGLNGIGYNDLDELVCMFSGGHNIEAIQNDLEPYKEENVLKTLQSAFTRIVEKSPEEI